MTAMFAVRPELLTPASNCFRFSVSYRVRVAVEPTLGVNAKGMPALAKTFEVLIERILPGDMIPMA